MAWAWLGIVVVLVVGLVVGVRLASNSKSVVRPASVPASWQKVTFGGLTMYVPGNLPVESRTIWNTCNPLLTNFSPKWNRFR